LRNGARATQRASTHHLMHRMKDPRRFPPPWTVEDIDAAFVVKDVSTAPSTLES